MGNTIKESAIEIKHPNWSAAGPETKNALTLLSDGAFRLTFIFAAIRAGGPVGFQ
jgi:hypothetical protein